MAGECPGRGTSRHQSGDRCGKFQNIRESQGMAGVTRWGTLAEPMVYSKVRLKWDSIQVPRGQLADCCVDSLEQCRQKNPEQGGLLLSVIKSCVSVLVWGWERAWVCIP